MKSGLCRQGIDIGLDFIAIFQRDLLRERVWRFLGMQAQTPQRVVQKRLAAWKFDLSVFHAVIQLQDSLLGRGQIRVRRKDQHQHSMPMRILAEVNLAQLETVDAQNSGENEIAEALALVAKRAHVPAKTVVAKGVR